MKVIIKKIILFCAPLALIIYPLDVFISKNLRQSKSCYGEYEVWNDIYESKINTDLAIYGSSRAWVNISPKILKDSLNKQVYNLGLDGHSFWLQYLRHLEYLKYNKAPKHIVLAVDFNSFNKRDDLYLYRQFLPYMLWNKNIKKFTKSYTGFSDTDYNIPLVRYLGKQNVLKESLKLSLFDTMQDSYRTNGYKGIDKAWNDDFDKAKKLMTSYNISIDTASVKLFKLFLSECSRKNIKTTIVYTPEYIEGQNFIKDRDKVLKIYQSFAKEYNLTFLDYSNNKICLNKNNFYNATHLNKNGSELFSQILAHDLLEIKAKVN